MFVWCGKARIRTLRHAIQPIDNHREMFFLPSPLLFKYVPEKKHACSFLPCPSITSLTYT